MLILWLLFLYSINEIIAEYNGNCVGCRKPAPPPCCPPTCPRCLPINQRTKPRAQPDTGEDVQIIDAEGKRSGWDHGKLIGRPERSLRPHGIIQQPRLLDDQDFYRNDLWTIPDGNCDGRDCPCANCVCCYTETYLCTTTVTCEVTATSTTTLTNSYTTFDVFSIIESVTNKIHFFVSNPFVFTTTETITVTNETPQTVSITVSRLKTSISIFYFGTSTAIGILGTITKSAPGGPTVTVIERETKTVATIFVPTIVTQNETSLDASTTSTVVDSFTLFKCRKTASHTVKKSRRVTPTLDSTIPYTVIGTAKIVEMTTETVVTEVFLTASKCKSKLVHTARYTPTVTIVESSGTPLPTRDECCPVHGCHQPCDCFLR